MDGKTVKKSHEIPVKTTTGKMDMHNKTRSRISDGSYDLLFKKLYCCNDDGLDYYKNRALNVIDRFNDLFPVMYRDDVCVFSSPGRLELTGNHSDHQGGAVLTGTVNADILACAAVNDSNMINIISEGYEDVSVDPGDTEIRTDEKNTTAALVRGMVRNFADKGFCIRGFDMYAVSDVPGGLGMSSSAAFEMLIGVVINHLFCGRKVTDEEIAYAGMFAEREYFGKPCGLMDQMACIKGGINIFDFRNADKPETKSIDVDLSEKGIDMIVTDTGTDHSDMADDFNAIPGEMYSAAAVLGGKRLSDIPEDFFYEHITELRAKAGDRAVMRAMHWYDEVKRVREQGENLLKGDISKFLENVNSSGYSSFMYLQNIDNYKEPSYQPVAFSLALAHHILGSGGAVRIQGGGFAGSIIAFVPKEKTERYISEMDKVLGSGSCRVVNIRTVGAVKII